MRPEEIRLMIADGESLKLEFKSDRGPLPDAELLEVCVCLANHQGGQVLIGVEDDGQITGLQPTHLTIQTRWQLSSREERCRPWLQKLNLFNYPKAL